MRYTIEELLKEIRASKEYFDRSTRPLAEDDSNFAPTPAIHTVAQKVTHVARTIEFFLQGAFSAEGFDMSGEGYEEELKKVTSLAAARKELERAYATVMEELQSRTEAEWTTLLPEGPMMGGEPRWKIVPAMIELIAHHRGALTVYTRLIGKVPPMPYMET